MKKVVFYFLLTALMIVSLNSKAYSQQRGRLADTNGIADVESSIADIEPFLQSLTSRIPACGNLDSIRFMVSPVVLLGDTLLNHVVRIYDGFNALHPQQYIPIENISDDLDHLMETKSLDKAKKYNQKIILEYNNLLKAK
jgi:hypothetical protein